MLNIWEFGFKSRKNIFKKNKNYEERKGLLMRYTFQDSNDFPVQKDFIQDLQDFITISTEAVTLEKSTIEIKTESREKTVNFEKTIQEIERFEKDLMDYIESRTLGTKERTIQDIEARILETLSNVVLAKKDEERTDLDNQNKLDLMEIQQLDERMLSILSPFFETSIYGARSSYHATGEDKKLRGEQVSFIDVMQYEFELKFMQDMLRVKDLQNLVLPIWAKSGILSREEKVKTVDVSDFYITNMEYDGINLRTVIEDKDPENGFIISADEKTFLVVHKDYEITGDEELAAALDRESVVTFVTKLKELFTEFVVSKKLVKIMLDGKNAIDENRIFDCLKIIASIYGQLVAECIKRGYTKGEISIKIEEPEGSRTEKYLEISKISKELSTLGNKGEELAAKLKITEA